MSHAATSDALLTTKIAVEKRRGRGDVRDDFLSSDRPELPLRLGMKLILYDKHRLRIPRW